MISVETFQRGYKITLESNEQHSIFIFPTHGELFFENTSLYRLIDIDTGCMGEWRTGTNSISVPPCLVESKEQPNEPNVALKCQRLPSDISSGWVYKIQFATKPGEIEHALQILVSGSIRRHPHFDITEGYRSWDLETGKSSNWDVVGVGMSTQFHEVPFKSGLQIVESSKRMPGIEAWPELQNSKN